MKAYKQITFEKEHRLVWSYAALLLTAGLILMIRPVLAHDRNGAPDVKVEIRTEYDAQGNLLKMDSVRTWVWSGREYTESGFDSIWQCVETDIREFLPRNFGAYGYGCLCTGPPLHNRWHWNGGDSTAYSYIEDLLSDEFLESLRSGFTRPRGLPVIEKRERSDDRHK